MTFKTTQPDRWELLSFYLVLRVAGGVLYPSSGGHEVIKLRPPLEVTLAWPWWAVPLLNALPWSENPCSL